MSGRAIRSRLLQLREQVGAARRGHALLDRKREVLLRAIRERREEARALEAKAAGALAEARARLAEARVELGGAAVDAAALAQPPAVTVRRQRVGLVGVSLPRLAVTVPPFVPAYAPAGTSARLDRAGAAFAAALPDLVRLAEARTGLARLREGLARTARRLGALEQVVIPDLAAEIRAITDAIEEEARDEAFRQRRARPAPRRVER